MPFQFFLGSGAIISSGVAGCLGVVHACCQFVIVPPQYFRDAIRLCLFGSS